MLLLFCVVVVTVVDLIRAEASSNNNNNNNNNNNYNMRLHSAYYSWYGNPAVDGEWIHWNHEILDGSGVVYEPPEDIGANFYPSLDLYSSADLDLIDVHMMMHVDAGIGVVTYSWWGQSSSDSNGGYTDTLVKPTMDSAAKFGLKVNFHLEPYPNRNASSTRNDLQYIFDNYGNHSAFYRDAVTNRAMFYVYDAYLTPAEEWATILDPLSPTTIRGSDIDGDILALYLDAGMRNDIITGHFDGFYTYFASTGFTEGSTHTNWKNIVQWARENSLISVINCGPGYNDTRIRPWNAANAHEREEAGAYYDRMFEYAIDANPDVIGITSFNEWHEGTQIEPAKPFRNSISGYVYEDYNQLPETYYLFRTRYFSELMIDRLK